MQQWMLSALTCGRVFRGKLSSVSQRGVSGYEQRSQVLPSNMVKVENSQPSKL